MSNSSRVYQPYQQQSPYQNIQRPQAIPQRPAIQPITQYPQQVSYGQQQNYGQSAPQYQQQPIVQQPIVQSQYFQEYPQVRELQQTKQVVEVKKPVINELYHVEREIQVLSVEDVEEPWKRKCVSLETQIYDLQTELARYKNMAVGDKVVKDDSQVVALEQKLRISYQVEDDLRRETTHLQDEIDQWRNRYQTVQQEAQAKHQQYGKEVREIREQLVEKDKRITKLEDQLRQQEFEFQQARRR